MSRQSLCCGSWEDGEEKKMMSNICSKEKVLGPVSGVTVSTSNISSFNTLIASCTTPPTRVELLRGVYLLCWMRIAFCLGMTLLMDVCEGSEVRRSYLCHHNCSYCLLRFRMELLVWRRMRASPMRSSQIGSLQIHRGVVFYRLLQQRIPHSSRSHWIPGAPSLRPLYS